MTRTPSVSPIEGQQRDIVKTIDDRRDKRGDALRYFGWFLELWADADDHLQPRVESARRAMDRLAGEGAAD
jgi:hypothetical protein